MESVSFLRAKKVWVNEVAALMTEVERSKRERDSSGKAWMRHVIQDRDSYREKVVAAGKWRRQKFLILGRLHCRQYHSVQGQKMHMGTELKTTGEFHIIMNRLDILLPFGICACRQHIQGVGQKCYSFKS